MACPDMTAKKNPYPTVQPVCSHSIQLLRISYNVKTD